MCGYLLFVQGGNRTSEDTDRDRRDRQHHLHSSTTRALHGTATGRIRGSEPGAAAIQGADYGGRYTLGLGKTQLGVGMNRLDNRTSF